MPVEMGGVLEAGSQLQGRYTIETVLGQGGMGAVYRAREETLGGKRVAIKEMQVHITDPARRLKAVAQFQREARILAALDHPGLVDVTHYFEENDKQYLVMSYIDGRTLDDVLDSEPDFLACSQVLGWLDEICDVLEYLHGQVPPIIFRDLKPSNIMLDSRGRMRLIDFGIARAFDQQGQTDSFIKGSGTAGFAPLEQYGRGTTDQRTDVYSLGATAYSLLTRTVPPPSVDLASGEEALEPPSLINPAVPPILNDLVLRMMAVYKDSRPRTVQEVRSALRTVDAATRRASPPGVVVEPASRGRLDKTVRLPEAEPPLPVRPEAVPRPAHRPSMQRLMGHHGYVWAVAVSPDGNFVISASADQTVRVWHLSSGTEVLCLDDHSDGVTSLSLSPDKSLLASAGLDRTVILYDMPTGVPRRVLEHPSSVHAVALSVDGRTAASGGWDQMVRIWDVETGAETHCLKGHTARVRSVAFSPDGRLLASASNDSTIRVRAADSAGLIYRLDGHTDAVFSLAFSSNGRLLASSSADCSVRLWDMHSGKQVRCLELTSAPLAVAFGPHDRLLATGGNDRMVRVWDVASAAPAYLLEGHTAWVHGVAFSPDSRHLVSASADHSIGIWDLAVV